MKKRDLLTRRAFLCATALSAAAAVVACAPKPAPAASPTTAPAEATEPTAAVVEAEAPAASSAPEEFIFWYPVGADYGEWLQNEFNDAGLGIVAKWEAGEYDENTKTMAALAAGNPPPVSYLGRWQHGDLATRNAIYALDERVDGSSTFKWTDIWDRLQMESLMWGKKWVIPYTTDTRALFYNKQVLRDAGLDPEQPPKTWPELQEMAVKITAYDDSGRIDRIGFTPTFGNPPVHVMFWTMLWCMGGSVEDDEMTKVTLMEKGPEAMKFLKDLMDAQGGYESAGAFTKALTLAEGIDAFSAGRVGLAMNGQWVFKNYQKYSPDLEYSFVEGPVFPEYNIIANYDGGGGWYFFKEGEGTDTAWKFVEYWMQVDNHAKFGDYTVAIPSTKGAGEAWAKINETQRRLFVSTANTVRWPRLLSGYLEYCGHVATMFNNVMLGGKDIEAELQAAQDLMQPLLDEHNAMTPPV
ncbi:MAG: extracellular solute-binding protein [Anaerolineae bacterium]